MGGPCRDTREGMPALDRFANPARFRPPVWRRGGGFDYGTPLTEDDVSSGRAVIDATRSAFVSLPVEVTRAHAVNEQIQIEVDRLNLKEAT